MKMYSVMESGEVKFENIPIGHLFFSFDTLWTRTDTLAGTDIAGKYGACSFELDDPVRTAAVEVKPDAS